jgi:hypothetical protein
MTTSRKRKPIPPPPQPILATTPTESSPTPPPTGKVFLGEEDKRLLQKLNKHLVNKLGLGGSRSHKV